MNSATHILPDTPTAARQAALLALAAFAPTTGARPAERSACCTCAEAAA